MHCLGSWFDWNDISLKNYYSPEQAYGNSKAAQILSTKYLTRLLDSQGLGGKIKCYSLHPGVVYTDLYKNVSYMKLIDGLARYVKHIVKKYVMSHE